MKNLDRTRLQAALIEATIQSAEEKIAQSPMPAETADEEKVRAILEDVREKEKRKRAKHFKRAWVIVAVALLAVLSGCAVMYKTGLVQFVVTRFEKHDRVETSSGEGEYPQTIETVKVPTVLPEGYEFEGEEQIALLSRTKWLNSSGEYIILTQRTMSTALYALDNESSKNEHLQIGKHTIFCYAYDGIKYYYVWTDDYEFSLESSRILTETELNLIISSIK